ncbi:Putative ATP-dependent 6-phosphofructokinase isozyme 2 [Pseudomonas sp. OF001]|uniref:1-phosphofructokinase family hexose kinase n=1 Tax=Pseudomonas sp. OF001 TaxID=2772300 RepID=UPI00191A2CE8|nr:1-phosphofructokinase family hexose kinase [Pseudomonas sp. OF001]CAD5377952.1 Putative ATP-dependent 6-phosphofructokinase isozyme 2 [Pseudomonas sp. OF001]
MPRIATLTLNPAMDLSTATAQVEPTRKLRCSLPSYDPGGGGINVARVVAELGGDVVAVYPAGGPFGDMLERILAALALPQLRVPIAGDTRESFTVDETATGRQFRFVLPGPELSAAEQQACLDAIAALDPAPEFIVLSGSFPPGVALAYFDAVAALARRIKARLVLDCSGEALAYAAGRGGIHLLKPSLSELATLMGGKVEGAAAQEAALRELIGRGVAEVIVLSLGGEGAVLASKEGIERFAPLDVPVCSAVGAGDSMVGAMVLALSRGWSLTDAVRYGIAAGSATILRPGTELCRAEDVERLYRG